MSLLLFAALSSGVGAVTIGELPICTPAKDVLASPDFSTLSAALQAASSVDIGDLPAGNLVVVAPTNDAFAAALKSLDMTAEELLADTELLTSILAVHLGVASGETAEEAMAISGNPLKFEVDGSPATLAASQGAPAISIAGPSNTVEATTPVTCVGGAQTYFPASGVLLPKAADAKAPESDMKSPSPKPTPMPSPMPTPTPSSGGYVGSSAMAALATVGGAMMMMMAFV
jgi:hypothetical protein